MDNKKKIIKEIVELIEDKKFPARRNITDYIELLVSEYNREESKELSEYIENLYKEIDERKTKTNNNPELLDKEVQE